MSLSVDPLPTVRVEVPQVAVNKKQQYAVLRGPNQNIFKPNVCNNYSTSQVAFTETPPNPQTVMDRRVRVIFPLQFSFTGSVTDSGNLLRLGTTDAPRAYPIMQVTNTLSANLNTTQVSIQANDVMQALLWYNNPVSQRSGEYSLTPSMLDQYQQYHDWLTQGSGRNPLAFYGENSAEQTRGGFPYVSSTFTNSPTAATVQYYFVEDLYLSPFLFGGKEDTGFLGLQQLNIQFNLDNLQRAWSHDASNSAVTISGLTVSFFAPPQMLFQYYKVNEIESLPKSMIYPYYEVQRFPINVGSLTTGSSSSVTSNTINLQSIPSKIYLFARQRNQDRTYTSSDAFGSLSNLNIQWNTANGLLSSATVYDLYNMAVENGCNMSWAQWSQQVGNVLCLQMGKDIGLSPAEAPGQIGNYQFVVTSNITNLANSTINFDFYIVVILEGTFVLEDNRALTQIGILTPADVLGAKNSPFIDYADLNHVYGGNIFSGLSTLIQRAVPFVRDNLLPIAKQVYDIPGVKSAVKGVASRYVGPLADILPGGGLSGGSSSRAMHAAKRRVKAQMMMGMGLGGQEGDDSQYYDDEDGEYEDQEPRQIQMSRSKSRGGKSQKRMSRYEL